ncbi:MAG TPA: phosphatidylserine decarboxylase family protein [Verrucomicrobiae bacterium]|nr:phosphatidylserine decarboxylase family protein [Verrucomicrobiae bacterium]
MFTARTLLAGRWPILIFAALSAALPFLNCSVWLRVVLTGISALLLVFTISFFRDPQRAAPADPKAIVSPADGTIVEIRTVHEPYFLNGEATMVAIFLSVFDVHVQRAPIEGEIKFVKYNKGKFLDARNINASLENENRVIGIVAADGFRVTVRQIAGLIARRIVGWADPGTKLTRGERLGMIRFGSRVELFLPPGVKVTARVDDYAKGGETVLARRK